jgi:two-component system response regulator NreC
MAAHLHLAQPAQRERSDATIQVVLAEDHAVLRRSLRRLLGVEQDIKVVAEAGDLITAMRQVAVYRPHVLVLDLRMPGGSSIEAIRRLRARVPQTEIVVLTMESNPLFARQALDAGAVGFVLKDRADSELPAAVRSATEGKEYVSALVSAALDALRRSGADDGLTPRELEILRLIALGFTSVEIGRQLQFSRRTVETHRARIHHKLALPTRAGLVRYALGRHLIGD